MGRKPCGHAGDVDWCGVCRWAKSDTPTGAAYRERWGVARAITDNRCQFLGEATGDTVTCPSCKGHVELKLFGCNLYADLCTLAKTTNEHRCCATCPSRSPSAGDGT